MKCAKCEGKGYILYSRLCSTQCQIKGKYPDKCLTVGPEDCFIKQTCNQCQGTGESISK